MSVLANFPLSQGFTDRDFSDPMPLSVSPLPSSPSVSPASLLSPPLLPAVPPRPGPFRHRHGLCPLPSDHQHVDPEEPRRRIAAQAHRAPPHRIGRLPQAARRAKCAGTLCGEWGRTAKWPKCMLIMISHGAS